MDASYDPVSVLRELEREELEAGRPRSLSLAAEALTRVCGWEVCEAELAKLPDAPGDVYPYRWAYQAPNGWMMRAVTTQDALSLSHVATYYEGGRWKRRPIIGGWELAPYSIQIGADWGGSAALRDFEREDERFEKLRQDSRESWALTGLYVALALALSSVCFLTQSASVGWLTLALCALTYAALSSWFAAIGQSFDFTLYRPTDPARAASASEKPSLAASPS